MSKRLFVDMDGTLAKFHDEVSYLERMWEPMFFRNLKPFDQMVFGVREFIAKHPDVEVFVLSSKILGEPPYCEMEKNAWLDKHLPEIDAAHRIFPAVGTPKAYAVPDGITADDYLLDDYNKSLREWEAAGGKAIKCHNNINQRGLGAYGGERGQLWEGAMVHTTDRPELIAAELAQHMSEDYDLRRVAEAYDLQIGYGRSANPEETAQAQRYTVFEVMRGNGTRIWKTYSLCGAYRKNYEMTFLNPLNAVRSAVGKRAFDELPILLDGELKHLTRAQLFVQATNLGINVPAVNEASCLEVDEVRDKLEEYDRRMGALGLKDDPLDAAAQRLCQGATEPEPEEEPEI